MLKALHQFSLPIHCITGVSAGAIVAAAYASGASPNEIARIGCSMRFSDVTRWSPRLLVLVGSDRMNRFLKRILKTHWFEEMTIPLGVVATDLATGQPVPFSGTGEVFDAIRASCFYPGLFRPVRRGGKLLAFAIGMGILAFYGGAHRGQRFPLNRRITNPCVLRVIISERFCLRLATTRVILSSRHSALISSGQ